jgi:hypothetical protein
VADASSFGWISIGCQNLRYTLINLNSFDIVSEGRLPLGKQTTLKWLGFSEDGVSRNLPFDLWVLQAYSS